MNSLSLLICYWYLEYHETVKKQKTYAYQLITIIYLVEMFNFEKNSMTFNMPTKLLFYIMACSSIVWSFVASTNTLLFLHFALTLLQIKSRVLLYFFMKYFHFLSISNIEQKWFQSKYTNHLGQKLDWVYFDWVVC